MYDTEKQYIPSFNLSIYQAIRCEITKSFNKFSGNNQGNAKTESLTQLDEAASDNSSALAEHNDKMQPVRAPKAVKS